ncbi:MAG: CheR family methyltransferase [Thermodesulfobacteriota bacterium]
MNEALFFVSRSFGLLPDSLGTGVVLGAVKKRMQETGIAEPGDYLLLAESSREEREALRDLLLVPETWFFRDGEPFAHFARWAAHRKLDTKKPLRVLCIACATGEEAYSAAASLFLKGFRPEDFTIYAMDASRRFLDRARIGRYGTASLREKGAEFPQDLFLKDQGCIRVSDRLRNAVQFFQGNVLQTTDVLSNAPYDAVFFRNALIYFTPEAQARAARNVDAALAPGGLLVLGFAEPPSVFFPGYEPVSPARSFSALKPVAKEPKRTAGRELRSIPAALPAFSLPHKEKRPQPAPAAERKPLALQKSPAQKPSESAVNVAGLLAGASKLADQGDLAAAWDAVTEVCSKDPANPEACFLAAQVSLALDRDELAETWLRKTLFLAPAHVRALGVFRVLLLTQGRNEEADLMGRRLFRAERTVGAPRERRDP